MSNDRFYAMRLKAATRWPYAAEAILSLVPVPTDQVPRMAIDRHWRVYFNPQWVADTVDEFVLVTLLHEFSHVCRRHFRRFIRTVGYDPEQLTRENYSPLHKQQSVTWNYATDLEINDDLQAEGLPIKDIPGGGAVVPRDYHLPNGWTAEQYFAKLWDEQEQQQQEQQARQSAGAGDDDQQSSDDADGDGSCESDDATGNSSQQSAAGADGEGDGGESADGGADQDSGSDGSDASDGGSPGAGGRADGGDPGDATGNGDGSGSNNGSARGTGNAAGHGSSGDGSDGDASNSVDWQGSSAADGFRRPWEYGKPGKPGKPGEDRDDNTPAGLTEAEQDHLANQVAKKIEAQVNKGRGSVAAGWRRWASETLRPQVPWQRVLRNTITRSIQTVSGCRDFTFSRVSRREPARRDLIPSSPIARRVKTRVVVDTSGSMSDKDLSLALAEVDGILRSSDLRDGVQVGSCDAAMHTCQKVFKRSQVVLAGGGGTDMRVPIDGVLAEKAATRPDVLIIITDGETPWPETPAKGVAVIAVITQASSYYDAPPAWIKSIKVN